MKNIFYIIKILLSNPKKIIIGILTSLSIISMLFFAFKYFSDRQSLIEKFTLPIVIEDENKYLNLVSGMLLDIKDYENIISMEIISKESADEKLKNEEIPCYIYIKEGFADSVIYGENNDIVFVGNKNISLPYTISENIVKAGVAFLSSSQSGIYATAGYAYENGVSPDDINGAITDNINIKFGLALLNYKSYFEEVTISPSGAFDLFESFVFSVIFFLLMIFSINFYSEISGIIVIQDRLKLCNFSFWKLISVIFLCLIIIYSIIASPLFYFFGFKTIFLIINISALCVFSSLFFKDFTSSGFFTLTISLVMLFISGGIIPKGLLPNVVNKISFLSVNNYFLQNANLLHLFLYTIAFLAVLFSILYQSKSREVNI